MELFGQRQEDLNVAQLHQAVSPFGHSAPESRPPNLRDAEIYGRRGGSSGDRDPVSPSCGLHRVFPANG
jgi:hypothetical protein